MVTAESQSFHLESEGETAYNILLDNLVVYSLVLPTARRNHMVYSTEAVEFKEAKSNYSFNGIGKYFPALSDEANLRSLKEGWLIFGITNKKVIQGTSYRQDKKVILCRV